MEINKFISSIEKLGKDLGYDVNTKIKYDIEETATTTFSEQGKTYLTVEAVYWGIDTKIKIYDKDNKLVVDDAIKGKDFIQKNFQYLVDKIEELLNNNIANILNSPEKIYDYGEENNWQGLDQKHYELLSHDKNLAQMAVADMQDKEIVVPDILKNFRRYSMSLKDVISSKIAKEKIATKKVASATKSMKKKAAWSDAEKKQVGALDDNAVGKYNIYQDMGGEIFVTKHKLNDKYALMDTAEDIDTIVEKVEKDWSEHVPFVGYDKELIKEVWFLQDAEEDDNGIVDLSKDYATEKKAAEEDLDVKLKVQKNKPAGLDTSSPKSLPESIRPLMQDLKGKISDVKEIETQLAARKAELDAKYQEAKNESKIVEKQAEIENLTNNIGKLLFAAKNETFQFQDNLVALTHQTKVVPAKATDKWKFEKVFEKLKSLMGDENAQKFLDATLNGLQSQATEKTITELNIFSPTQKQVKKSDTSDTNKLIDALKEIYTNLRAYFLDVKKANNIIEEQLATGTTASKTNKLNKKAYEDYVTEEDVLFKIFRDFEMFTEEEIELCQGGWGNNLETAETMLYVRTGLRSLDQLRSDLESSGHDMSDYQTTEEKENATKTEVEGKKKVNMKKAKKEFVDINGKTWKEFLDNIKNEGYAFDEKLYEEKVTTIPKVITVSKGGHSDKVVAFWNDDREEYGISNRMDA